MSGTSVEETIKARLKVRKYAHMMFVEGMSKLWTHKVKTCLSSVFNLSGHNWKLIVHPAGKNGTSDHLSLHLRIKDKKSLGPSRQVKRCLRLIRVAQNGDQQCHSDEWVVYYNASQAIHGKDDFIPHELLKRDFLVNDKVILGVEFHNVKPKSGTRTEGTAERLILTEVPRNNCRFTWKINQFSSFNGIEHSSYQFTVGPRRWKIVMYPKGNEDGTGNSLSLYLTATNHVTPNAKTLAVYKLRVLDQLHRKHHELEDGSNWFHYMIRIKRRIVVGMRFCR